MLPYKFNELFAAGCIQTGADAFDTVEEARPKFKAMFTFVMQGTTGNPCPDCPVKEHECAAYKQYHSSQVTKAQAVETRRLAATTPPSGESVAKAAVRLGISKNEVRRRKQAGTLETV